MFNNHNESGCDDQTMTYYHNYRWWIVNVFLNLFFSSSLMFNAYFSLITVIKELINK